MRIIRTQKMYFEYSVLCRRNVMRLEILTPIACLLALVQIAIGSAAYAAGVDEHIPYRVISYNFSSDEPGSQFSSLTYGPLMITGTTADVLTNTPLQLDSVGNVDPKNTTDIFAVSANFSPTPDISLHGSFGITKNRWEAAFNPDYESGWETNLSIIYKLFNNINYEVHFGYMDTGDLFEESDTYTGVESIIMINSKLTMSF